MKIQGSVASVKLLGVQWSGACQTPFFLKTKDKYHNPLYVESRKKWYKWSLLTKQKETHRLRKQTQGSQGEEIVKDFGKVMYTLLYLKWITNKNLLYGTWSSAQCYVPAWVGEGFGGKWIHACVCWVPSLFTWNCHSIVNRLYPDTKCFWCLKK